MATEKKSKGMMHKLKKMLGMETDSKPSVAKTSGSMKDGSTSSKKAQIDGMAEIARRSALVKNSTNPSNMSRASKNSDLMGELTDDFHANKDKPIKEAKKEEKKEGEVWD